MLADYERFAWKNLEISLQLRVADQLLVLFVTRLINYWILFVVN